MPHCPVCSRSTKPTATAACASLSSAVPRGRPTWRPIGHKEGLTLPYYADGTRTLYDLFADATIPRIYIADSQGAVCYMHTDNPLPDCRHPQW